MEVNTFRSRARRWWRKEIRPLLIVALVMFSARSSLADWNDVPSGSMKPTVFEGDRVFVNKLAYDLKVPFTTWRVATWADPQRGDIIVFPSPADGIRLVKRVVAVPGDRIKLREDRLFINGQPASYVLTGTEDPAALVLNETVSGRTHPLMIKPQKPARRWFGPVEVPPGRYFVMGDNRDNSFDSRYFGVVERKRIVGRATDVVLSLDPGNHWLPRRQRFFRPLDAADPG